MNETTLNYPPMYLEIDPTTLCNYRCVMCHNAHGSPYVKTHIDLDIIRQIRDFSLSVPDTYTTISVAGSGELLIHPQWREVLSILSEGKCDLDALTNGALLKDEDIDFIWEETSVKCLQFSIDASSGKTYRNIRGGNFADLSNTIRHACSHPSRKMVRLGFCVMHENAKEIPLFMRYCKWLGADGVIYQQIHDREYKPVEKPEFVFDKTQILPDDKRNPLIAEAMLLARRLGLWMILSGMPGVPDMDPEYNVARSRFFRSPTSIVTDRLSFIPKCWLPWTMLNRTHDGNWRVCCMSNMSEEVALGGANASIQEAWNSKQIQNIRLQMLSNKKPDECDARYCSIAADLQKSDGVVEVEVETENVVTTDPRDTLIARIVKDCNFLDVGGLWHDDRGAGEKVSVASEAGATSVSLLDVVPVGHPLWRYHEQQMCSKNITAVSISSDMYNAPFKYDVVHCSGVIYHQPSIKKALKCLRKLTNRYLILSSIVVPKVIENSRGRLEVSDALHIPDLTQDERNILIEDRKSWTGDAVAKGITDVCNFDNVDYEAWYWLPTVDFLQEQVESLGFRVREMLYWNHTCHVTFLLESITPTVDEYDCRYHKWRDYHLSWEDQYPDLGYLGDEWGGTEPEFEPALRRLCEGDKVLEIGCGGGKITKMLLDKQCDVTISDISVEMIERTSSRFPDVGSSYLIDSIEWDLPQVYDAVVSYDVFVHIDPLDVFYYLREIAKVLCDNGVAILHWSDTESDAGFVEWVRWNKPHTLGETEYKGFCVMTCKLFHNICDHWGLEIIELQHTRHGRVVATLQKNSTILGDGMSNHTIKQLS